MRMITIGRKTELILSQKCASADGGVQGARLGEKKAAAVEKIGGADKVRIHGYDFTMTRGNSGKGYVAPTSGYV